MLYTEDLEIVQEYEMTFAEAKITPECKKGLHVHSMKKKATYSGCLYAVIQTKSSTITV